jgi:hypothetical protein
MDKGIPSGNLQPIVTCSCRRKNTLRLTEGKFKPLDDKGWTFKKPGGWTCGRKSHTQASTRLVPVSTLISH